MTTASPLLAPLTAREVLRADIDVHAIMADPKLRQSARVFRSCVGSLRAIGYGPQWIAEQIGCDVADVMLPAGAYRADPRLMRSALTLAVRIGDRRATSADTGQSPEQIEAVTDHARADRCYPPACFDETYTYMSRAYLSPTQAGRSGVVALRCEKRIRAVAHFLQFGGTGPEVGARFGMHADALGKLRTDLGITCLDDRGHVLPSPGQDAVTRLFIDAETALDVRLCDPIEVWEAVREAARALRAVPAADTDDDLAEAA